MMQLYNEHASHKLFNTNYLMSMFVHRIFKPQKKKKKLMITNPLAKEQENR